MNFGVVIWFICVTGVNGGLCASRPIINYIFYSDGLNKKNIILKYMKAKIMRKLKTNLASSIYFPLDIGKFVMKLN